MPPDVIGKQRIYGTHLKKKQKCKLLIF